MKTTRAKYAAPAVLMLANTLLATAQDAPKYSNEFLAIGVGARALGMGTSYISTCNDVTSGYWNPAGLLGVRGDLQLGGMHNEYFAGIGKYDYVGLAKPLDSMSTLGVSVLRFGVDDIPNTTDLFTPEGQVDYDRITTFSAADHAFLISYARKLRVKGLRVGGNAKIIYRRVGDFAKAWGFGLDAGAQYDHGKWRFAAMARDVTSTFNAWTYTLDQRTIEVFEQTLNELPENGTEVTLPKLDIGLAREFKIKKLGVIAELDLQNSFDGKRNTLIASDTWSGDPRLGLEVGYAGVVFVRFGVNNFQYVTDIDDNEKLNVQPNLGLGLKIKNVALDYALSRIVATDDVFTNVFSLRLDIFKKGTS